MWFKSDSTRPQGQATAIIVEDEQTLAEELAELLVSLWPQLKIVALAYDGLAALRLIAEHEPDIVFLDIQIPGPSGLDVARFIADRCHVVFVTAYEAHAIDAFERGALDYLLKPIAAVRVARTVERLKDKLRQAPPDMNAVADTYLAPAAPCHLRWITATVGHSLRLVSIDEVIYFQANQKYSRVVLADSEVLIRKSLKELLSELDPEQFWKLHRSIIVNAREIASMEPDLSGEFIVKLKRRRERLPVSDSFLRRFRSM